MSQVSKITAEKNHRALLELVNQPGNDACADCKARNPRWASFNLGIFICMNCASIHRKIGTHITKVKSVTLDSWTKEQVQRMKEVGNTKSNEYYNPHESRNPPPTNMIDSERDSDLEKYIRSKYEFKSFVDKSAFVAARLGPSRSASSKLSSSSSSSSVSKPVAPPKSTPSISTLPVSSSPAQQLTTATATPPPASALPASVKAPFRSVSQPIVSPSTPLTQPQLPLSNATWNDLVSLQTPAANASLPLQYASSTPAPQFSAPTTQSIPIPQASAPPSLLLSPSPGNPYGNLSINPNNHFPSALNQMTGISPGRSMSLGTGLGATQPGISPPAGLTSGLTAQGGSSPYMPSMNLTPNPAPTFSPSPNPFTPQGLPTTPGVGAGVGVGAGYGTASAFSMGSQPALGYNPSPNPFGQQPQQHQVQVQTPQFQSQPGMQIQLPQGSPINPFAQMGQQQQQLVQSPYGGPGTPFGNPSTPSPFIPTTAAGMSHSPFLQSTTPSYAPGTPSPYAASQPLPQMSQLQLQQQQAMQQQQAAFQQQQQQQNLGGVNPFTSWIQQGQVGGGGYGQQWGS